MTSQINTNGIDTNYPIPGQNNSSQGFRDNFSQIRTNLNTASAEITDLQTKVVLKAALDNTVLNNDMANTLISNASVRSFRHTTYNLGNALSGTVLVDASLADHQFGSVQANTTLQFGRWAPTNTKQTITLNLSVANTDAVISFPNAAIGVSLLENYRLIGNTATITAPANVTAIELDFTTTDCGNTILVTPANRPYQSTQIINRVVPPTGLPGDVAGTVAVDANYIYVCTDSFDSNVVQKTVGNTFSGNLIQMSTTNNLVVNAPIIFAGNVDTANTNLVSNTVYYIKTIVNVDAPLGNITISGTRTGGTAGSTFAVGAKANLTINANAYVGTDVWKRIALTTW
jgi:hypothetical protein